MSTERIAVLGAGPMGLGAAYQLVKDGRKPVIFEADDRVGGMAACFDFGGLSIERYYHFHAISDHAFFEVLLTLNAPRILIRAAMASAASDESRFMIAL